jgi:hypothetical protein
MDKRLYWNYDHKHKWQQVEKPYLESTIDISDFLEKQDYLLEPDLCCGDELNFLSVFDHPFKEEFLFHLVIDNFSKIIYANSLPAMLELFVELNQVLNAYFRTALMMEDLKDEEFQE